MFNVCQHSKTSKSKDNMGSRMIDVVWKSNKVIKVEKWKIKKGMTISARQVIMLYTFDEGESGIHKFKATQVGTVCKICKDECSIVKPGETLVELEECTHPTVMADMCAECGADLRQSERGAAIGASVPMVHCIPELKVSLEQAQILGKADEQRLLGDKKLVLLVDLDQTLIHTTNDNIPPNLKDVVHFQLYGQNSPWYHTRIRPGTQKFLQSVSELYELHICTFGARSYAHYIAMFLDPDGRFFSHRILSRDECFDPNSKTANLSSLFPCGDAMVCIIDDREDVWNFAPNLIHVKPYHFFQHTGDINAPPGLTKCENDTTEGGFDFTKMGLLKTEDSDECQDTSRTNSSKSTNLKSGETTTDKDTEDEGDTRNRPSKSKIPEENESLSIIDDADKDITAGDMEILERNEVESKGKRNSETAEGEKFTGCIQKKVASIDDHALIESRSEANAGGDTIAFIRNNEKITNSEIESEDKADVKKNKPEEEGDFEVISEDKGLTTAIDDVLSLHNEKEKENTEDTKNSEMPLKENELGSACENLSVGKEDENAENMEKRKEKADAQDENADSKREVDDELIEVEDNDDYLLYLEDILRKIHTAYYGKYKESKNGVLPDLKEIVPYVKRCALYGCVLVLSGIIPSHVPMERSRAYQVAVSLGAKVQSEVTATTTHLVAARAGTAKVNSARRYRGIHVVTPNWLWHCAERWELLDERLYPLGRGVRTNKHPPAHCGSPQHVEEPIVGAPIPRRFSETINPLLTLSSEDVAHMGREVEELCQEEDDSDSDEDKNEVEEETRKKALLLRLEECADESNSSTESLSERPKGKSRKRKMETTTCTESDFDDESPSVKFRRGEPLPSDLDFGEESFDDSQDQDAGDDSAWTLMGAALEREFLAGD